MKNQKILEVKNIKQSFGKNIVLKDVSFDLFRGEKIAIVGENGCGKTILMEIISSLMKQDGGTIKFNFNNSDDNSISKNLGMQFQDSEFPNGISVGTLISFYKKIYRGQINNKKVNDLMKIFKIDTFMDQTISKLSGGQKQRLNLLLAIIHNPIFLILDEISTGLDIKSRKSIIEYIKDLDKELNLSIIIISHNSDEIESLVDRILFLKDGIIQDNITLTDIKKKHATINEYLLATV